MHGASVVNAFIDGIVDDQQKPSNRARNFMTRISLLLSTGLGLFRTADSHPTVARRQASESLAPEGADARNPLRGRGFLLSVLLLGAIAALWGTTATAQSNTIYVEPVLLYESGPYAPHFFSTVGAAFADAQSQVAANSNAYWSHSALNERADDRPGDAPYTYYDGFPALWRL
jgi:hypothetical protein